MDQLKLTGTDESPEVLLDKNTGEFKFSGKSLPEDVKSFYRPILDWISEYAKDANDETVVEFRMIYFNSASSKQILDILEHFQEAKNAGKKVLVKWYYMDGDEDMSDAGDSYQDLVDVDFELIAY
ncbi:MAG: DUF1987 domain-containing protein [Salinivirgaceae bacterium]|nr:DUF1987 domain-containing protein [Salinivirgaceae bacterium]